MLLARTYGLRSRRALYEFMPDPRDLAEHEEEYRLYRWGPELDKYLAAQVSDAVAQAAGGPSRSLESRLLRFDGDEHEEKHERLKESQAALKQATATGSGWLTTGK